jgi:transcriptional regulator with XRE-family HTH domain
MTYTSDFATASSAQIEATLCKQVERIRLARNITQAQLAERAGVSLRTVGRLEKGEGVSLDTFIRVLKALGLHAGLAAALPDPTVRPVERVRAAGHERRRARPQKAEPSTSEWTWGDEGRSDGE